LNDQKCNIKPFRKLQNQHLVRSYLTFLKEVSYAHQGYYKNTFKG